MIPPRNRWATTALLGTFTLLSRSATAQEGETAWRLFVADHTSPTITAIDLDASEQRWCFDIAGPAERYPSPSKALVVAVQSDDEQVDFLRSGLALESHGDHADIEVSDPAAIGAIEGLHPSHVVNHDGEVAITFDEGGYASVLGERDILEGTLAEEKLPMNVAHHGVVVSMGDHFISSIASDEPVAADEAPARIGIGAFMADNTPKGEMHAGTELHGEAFLGTYLLAGCREGIVALDTKSGVDAFTMLTYPADFPEGNTGTLLGSPAMQIFLGTYGADSVVIVDPTTEPYFTRVKLPLREVDFVLDCGSACKKAPVSGVIGVQEGPLISMV